MVRSQPPAGADRVRAPGGVRSGLRPSPRDPSGTGDTHVRRSPGKPGRFNLHKAGSAVGKLEPSVQPQVRGPVKGPTGRGQWAWGGRHQGDGDRHSSVGDRQSAGANRQSADVDRQPAAVYCQSAGGDRQSTGVDCQSTSGDRRKPGVGRRKTVVHGPKPVFHGSTLPTGSPTAVAQDVESGS
jgi:hypothetical protein